MNENHERHLISTLRHIDGLLREAEQILATAEGEGLFVECAQDSTPVQRKVVHDYIQRVREVMRQGMNDLGLPPPKPLCGALWAASSRLTFVQVALAEMEPRRMRGYGPLSDEDARRITALVAELNAALDRLMDYLGRSGAGDLQARVQRLARDGKEVDRLRELERVITAEGMVEFRGALGLLLDRFENGAFEIGVFGRVSSGKSSLLNHLLGGEILPVGVTPVTAIPTRLKRGRMPRALIEFADRQPLEVELSRLAEFCTEQHNPQNRQHVARIEVEVTSPRLPEGVTFVDTPGLGSLATRGAEEARACLPRCDLGLVLVDAASTVTAEDLALLDVLFQSGARAMALVSKADLLRPAERREALAYISGQIQQQCGFSVPVHLVSVVGNDAALCEQWFEGQLRPLLEAHHQEAEAALKRKIENLQRAVEGALQARARRQAAGSGAASLQRLAAALARLRQADALIAEAQSEADRLADEMPKLKEELIEVAVSEFTAAAIPSRRRADEVSGACGASVSRALSAHAAWLAKGFDELRERLEAMLADARTALGAAPAGEEFLPEPRGLPILEAEQLDFAGALQAPRLMRLLGAGALRRWAESRLRRELDGPLADLLSDHRRRLRHWSVQTVAEIRAAFDAQAGPLRAALESRLPPASRPSPAPMPPLAESLKEAAAMQE